MKVIFSLCIFFVLSHLSIFAQDVSIKGSAKTYSGDELKIYTYTDYITKNKKLLSTAKVAENGDFAFIFKCNEVKYAFIDLDVFKGVLYIEPKQNYRIVLPKKQVRRLEDKLNPYFKPFEFYFSHIDIQEDDLNFLIPNFDNIYSKNLPLLFSKAQAKYSKNKTDSVINLINKQSIKTSNQFYNNYKKYRLAYLRYIAYQRDKEGALKANFSGKTISYNNPAYMELFNEIFTDFFTLPSDMFNIKDIYVSIYDKSLYSLLQTIQANPVFESYNFAEFAILKGLFDAYNSQAYDKEPIIAVLDSLILYTDNMTHRKIAESMRTNMTRLMTGYPPPFFSLKNRNNETIKLTDFAGKFLYINFCNPKSYTCVEELELLKTLKKRTPDMLEIISIFVDDTHQKMVDFLNKNPEYKWTFLFYNGNNQLLKDYKIKAYPMYYMVNPEGKLVLNPAPSPTEEIEMKYIHLFQDWKRQQIRNQNKNKSLGNE